MGRRHRDGSSDTGDKLPHQAPQIEDSELSLPTFVDTLRGRLVALNAQPVAWLFVAFLALYGLGAATQQLMWLVGLAGIVAFLRKPGNTWRLGGLQAYWGLLACIVVPGLLALPDAADPGRAFSTLLRLLVYGFAGVWLIRIAPSPEQWPRTILTVLALLVFWSADGLLQEVVGVNVFGQPPIDDVRMGHKISGSMGMNYGETLAILSPLLFEALRVHGGRRPWLWLSVPLFATAITLSGSRNSLLLFIVSGALFFLLQWFRVDRKGRLKLLALGLVGLTVGVLLPVLWLPYLGERMVAVAQALEGDWNDFSIALSYRPDLWRSAFQLFLENPINGVGLRSSGDAMLPYLKQSPLFPMIPVQDGWYPHLNLLEVAADLGLIGILGFGVLLIRMGGLIRRAPPPVVALVCVALLAFFPLSASLSLFSYRITLLGWPALALAMAMAARYHAESGWWGTPPGRVLIIRLSAIGDVVFASPLIGAVRRTWPQARISWLVEPPAAPLLVANPDLEEVIVWNKAHWRTLFREKRYRELWQEIRQFRRELRRRRFDVVFDVQGLIKSSALAWLSGARQRVGFVAGERNGPLLTRALNKRADTTRIGSEYLGFAEDLGLDAGSFAMDIALSEADLVAAVTERARGPYAVICPFTTRPQKHWVDEYWFELAEWIDRRFGYRVLMLGGPGDREHAGKIASGSVIHNRVGTQSLSASAALISRSSLLLGVDTGLTHMGVAFNIPTVALFGSTCPYRETPGANARILYHALPCSPCRRRPTCNGRFQCLTEMTPDEVITAIGQVLGES